MAKQQDKKNERQAISFSTIIGSPLDACIDAQAMAAKTTWEFTKTIGLNTAPKAEEKKPVDASFQNINNSRKTQTPLLTIVPIPDIQIHNIPISFEQYFKEEIYTSYTAAEKSTDFHITYSSKKDSITNDVVKPGENKVPAGVAKVLEQLRSSLNISNLTDTRDSECQSEEKQ